MRRVLITGVGGFTGRHLVEHLGREGVAPAGLGTAPSCETVVEKYYCCDLTNRAAIMRVVEEFQPEEVYHLAACSPAESPQRIHEVIVGGFQNLYTALLATAVRRGAKIRLLTVGSAAELGSAGVGRLPVREDAPCEPATYYGRAKLAVTRFIERLPSGRPVEVVAARTFNLVGPGMGEQLSLGRFARQIVAWRRGEVDRIRCGNLSHRRDFVDVRDAADAYLALVKHGRAGQVYNVAAGRSHVLHDLLEQLLVLADCPAPIECEVAEPRLGDVQDIYGDTAKIAADCGWRATTPLERSLGDLLAAASEKRRGLSGPTFGLSRSA